MTYVPQFTGLVLHFKYCNFRSDILYSEGDGVYFNDYFNWRNIPQFSKLVHESHAAQIAAQLMGSKMR